MSLESKGCPGERRNTARPGVCSGTLPGGSQRAGPAGFHISGSLLWKTAPIASRVPGYFNRADVLLSPGQ